MRSKRLIEIAGPFPQQNEIPILRSLTRLDFDMGDP
jgi:hypothetical protein